MYKSLRMAALVTIAFCVDVVGCAALGLAPPAPKTFMEGALAAQLSVTSVRSTATQLLTAKAISVTDAKNAQAAANTANDGIDVAVGLYTAACPPPPPAATGPVPVCTSPSAEAKLSTMLTILTVTQTYLNKYAAGAKP